MKRKLGALFLCFFLCFVARSWATILPDSCGKDEEKFSVKKLKYDRFDHLVLSPAPEPPEPGKAQIIFIENFDTAEGLSFTVPTTRFGIDGTWAGANRDSS